MKRLKRMKALQETYKMWSELAETGHAIKPNGNFVHDCACCEYVTQKVFGKNWRDLSQFNGFHTKPSMDANEVNLNDKDINCKDLCPMMAIWPNSCVRKNDYNSYFRLWDLAQSNAERKHYAQQIADGAKEVLLGGGGV